MIWWLKAATQSCLDWNTRMHAISSAVFKLLLSKDRWNGNIQQSDPPRTFWVFKSFGVVAQRVLRMHNFCAAVNNWLPPCPGVAMLGLTCYVPGAITPWPAVCPWSSSNWGTKYVHNNFEAINPQFSTWAAEESCLCCGKASRCTWGDAQIIKVVVWWVIWEVMPSQLALMPHGNINEAMSFRSFSKVLGSIAKHWSHRHAKRVTSLGGL